MGGRNGLVARFAVREPLKAGAMGNESAMNAGAPQLVVAALPGAPLHLQTSGVQHAGLPCVAEASARAAASVLAVAASVATTECGWA